MGIAPPYLFLMINITAFRFETWLTMYFPNSAIWAISSLP